MSSMLSKCVKYSDICILCYNLSLQLLIFDTSALQSYFILFKLLTMYSLFFIFSLVLVLSGRREEILVNRWYMMKIVTYLEADEYDY